MRNDNPFMPWNNPMNSDDPFKVYNSPMHKDDPFAPWNSPCATKRDYDRYCEKNNIPKRDR